MLNRLLSPLAFGTGLYLLLLVGAGSLHGAAGLDGLWLTRRLPTAVTAIAASLTGAGLVAFAWGALQRAEHRAPLAAALSLFAAWALWDVVSYARLASRGIFQPAGVIPASAIVAALFVILAAHVLGVGASFVPPTLALDRSKLPLLAGVLVPLLAPLVQFATFGTTRYEREADVALVMGAGVFPDGRVSNAAGDRVGEAVRLYERGLVKRVVMLAGDENEGSGMAGFAVRLGMDPAAVSYRSDCVNTERAAALSAAELTASGETALVVSHYYHLPRIHLLYAREGARSQIRTVPAVMGRRLRKEPYYLAREIASTYHELIFRSKVGPVVKRWLS